MQTKLFWGSIFSFFMIPFCLYSASPTSQPSSAPSSQPASGWRLQKVKNFPNWRVEIITKDNPASPLGIEASKALIKDLNGKIKVEVKDILIEPDPKQNIEGWVPGTVLDIDKDGLEDLVLQTNSAGAHCCYSYQIFSLGKILKKLGDLKLFDCGEKIKLQDLDGTGQWQILTCNSKFTYLKGIAFAQSPFPPQVFGLVGGKFTNADKKYLKVFDDDIAEEKKSLAENYSDTAVMQIVLDYLLSGRETHAWQEFDTLYTHPNKEARKQELQDRWNQYLGLKPESNPESNKTGAASKPASSTETGWKLP